ncbi:hypothetical protein OG440_02330 [Streptomyces sp. NBC_00637]|uniref:DUF6766 family protein n=1 Tax=Streptomyces sp. NBC_00637 TaxID=2903667 RepID=UPI003244C184
MLDRPAPSVVELVEWTLHESGLGAPRQSELLAVASLAILSIHLRQRGSPESKPVGASHSATGVEG